jgi:hypothetical protein
VPSMCGSVRNRPAAAQSKCAVAVRSMHEAAQSIRAAAAAIQNTRAEVRSYKDALKMRHADCMRRPDLRKAAGSYCCEAHLASSLSCPHRRNSDGLKSRCRNWRSLCRYSQ